LLAAQLRDLRTAWRHLGAERNVNRTQMTVCGDSPISGLPSSAPFSYPRRIDNRPPECQPQGSLLALLLSLFENDVASVEAAGGLIAFRTLLDTPFVQCPHSCVPPDALRAGDLPDLVAALVPRDVKLGPLVDGVGRVQSTSTVREAYQSASEQYASSDARGKLTFIEP
jgi:hypothetical protein